MSFGLRQTKEVINGWTDAFGRSSKRLDFQSEAI